MDTTFDAAAVLQQLSLTQSSPELQQQVIDGLYQLLQANLQKYFQTQMTEDDYKTFVEIPDDAQAQAWLAQRFPDYRRWFEAELQAIVGSMVQQANTAVAAAREYRQQQ